METTRKTQKIERRLELIIWPVILIISIIIIKLNLEQTNTMVFSGLFLIGSFLFYCLTYALIPPTKHYLKNITDPIFLSLLILLAYFTKSNLSLLFLIPIFGSLLALKKINTLLISLLSILVIAAEIILENVTNRQLIITPEYLSVFISIILTFYLRQISQQAYFENILKLEEQHKLAETNKHLQEMEHQGKEFTTLAAQQIFTPLATIQSFIQTIGSEIDGKLSARQKQFIGETSNYIEKMHKMLRELLYISKIEFSGYNLNMVPIDIIEILKKSINKFESISNEKNIKIDLKFPEEIPTLKGDESNLEEVFDRIIDNALRYSPKETSIEIISQVVQKEDGPHLTIEIKDHGYGIPLEEQKYLFRKFFRGTNILPIDNSGNGLSLFITKLILDKHSGQIHIKSEINNGTAVQLDYKLPVNQSLKELRNKIPSSKIQKKMGDSQTTAP